MKTRKINYIPFKLNDLIKIKKIVTIHYQEIDLKYQHQGESHNFWEIMFIDKNKLDISINGNDFFTLNQKDVFFIKPNDFHTVKCDKGTNLFIISFECNSPSMNYFKNKKLTLNQDGITYLSNIIREAKSTFNIPKFDPDLKQMKLLDKPTVGGQQVIHNYLELFLIYLLRLETEKTNSEISFYSKDESSISELIVRYLKEHIYSKLDLDTISKDLHFSKSYICNVFKKEMNVSIISYFIKLKIEESKKLIQTNKSNKYISESLHFNDSSHFINSFKKITGFTPREYKELLI